MQTRTLELVYGREEAERTERQHLRWLDYFVGLTDDAPADFAGLPTALEALASVLKEMETAAGSDSRLTQERLADEQPDPARHTASDRNTNQERTAATPTRTHRGDTSDRGTK